MSRYIEVNKAMDLCTEFFFSEETCSVENLFNSAPSIDIVRCEECKHQEDCERTLVLSSIYGEIGDYANLDFCSYGSRSEKPNNCEHITEDGVTCAKYPACDDCLDNPLNKVKGSERLVKGSERSSE